MKYVFYSVLAICITVIVCFCVVFLDAEVVDGIILAILIGFGIKHFFSRSKD